MVKQSKAAPFVAKPGGGGRARRFFEDVVLAHDTEECLFWPFGHNYNGYGRINGFEEVLVHRLVCRRVYGPPPTPDAEAAHSCGQGHRGCVAKKHLRWATPTENSLDKHGHGTMITLLTEDDVRAIRAARGSIKQPALAAKYGVSINLISLIQRGLRWKWVR